MIFPELAGKTAIVTGGTRGIGYAVAAALAANGVNVGTFSRGDGDGAAAAIATEYGVKTAAASGDVAGRQSVTDGFAALERELGPADLLVNSAGIAQHKPALEMSEADWDAVQHVNLRGTFNTNVVFAQHRVLAGGGGAIVNVSSMSGSVVNLPQTQCTYNVSKAGVDMLTKSLAIEWLPHRIRVNAVAPGYIETSLSAAYVRDNPEMGRAWTQRMPTGAMGTPADVASACLFLLSGQSAYIVGEVMTIDGAYSIV